MTELEKLRKVCDIINEDGIDIDYRGKASICPVVGVYDCFNACAFLDDNLIDVYADDIFRDAGLAAAGLIHEWGHFLADRRLGDSHTERDAWEYGMMAVPGDYHPANMIEVMEFCLREYESQ